MGHIFTNTAYRLCNVTQSLHPLHTECKCKKKQWNRIHKDKNTMMTSAQHCMDSVCMLQEDLMTRTTNDNLTSPHPQTPSLERCGGKCCFSTLVFADLLKKPSTGKLTCINTGAVRLFRLHFLHPTGSSSVLFKFKSFFVDNICYRWSAWCVTGPSLCYVVDNSTKKTQNLKYTKGMISENTFTWHFHFVPSSFQ